MIQLPKGLVVSADERCYIVGRPHQRPDKGHDAPKMGKDMSQPSDL